MKLYFLSLAIISLLCGCTLAPSSCKEPECEKTCCDSLKCDSVKAIIDTPKIK